MVNYALQYGRVVPLPQATQILVHNVKEVIGAGWGLWMLAGLGLIAGLYGHLTRASTGFLLGLLAFSALALSPGFYFRYHYFILVLPAVSLLVGVAISKLSDLVASGTSVVRFIPLLLLGFALSLSIFWEKTILLWSFSSWSLPNDLSGEPIFQSPSGLQNTCASIQARMIRSRC